MKTILHPTECFRNFDSNIVMNIFGFLWYFLNLIQFYSIDPLFALIVVTLFQKKINICLRTFKIKELVNLYKTLLKVQLIINPEL